MGPTDRRNPGRGVRACVDGRLDEPESRLARAIALLGYHRRCNEVARRSHAKIWRPQNRGVKFLRCRITHGPWRRRRNIVDEPPLDHPDPARVAAFSRGILDYDQMAEVEDHLSVCESCRQVLSSRP